MESITPYIEEISNELNILITILVTDFMEKNLYQKIMTLIPYFNALLIFLLFKRFFKIDANNMFKRECTVKKGLHIDRFYITDLPLK